MSEYKEVNITEYVEEGLKNGTLVPRKAEKYGKITVRKGVKGEEVISWIVDKKGNPLKEKVDYVSLDENGQPGWVATKLGEDLLPVIDKNGHKNQWIIKDAKLREKYVVETPGKNAICRPIRMIQLFVQITEDIVIVQKNGKKMTVEKGGYINITNWSDMYAISKKDFEDTYRFVDEEPGIKKTKK